MSKLFTILVITVVLSIFLNVAFGAKCIQQVENVDLTVA
nr:unnamed protein product [Callosobruchus analis]